MAYNDCVEWNMICLMIGIILVILAAVGIVALGVAMHLRWIDQVIERAKRIEIRKGY